MSKGLIEVKVTGADKVQQAVLELARRIPQRIAQALQVEAELTMTEAKLLCPVVTGALRASGFVTEATVLHDDIGVLLGFGGPAAPYALVTHENPRAGQTGGVSPQGRRYKRWSRGGQWKFLEQPVLARTQGFSARIRGYALGEF
jgi:hypothetical protein